MAKPAGKSENLLVISRHDFICLLRVLNDAGYTLVGPTIRDQAIVYDQIRSEEELPIGWTDVQEAGTYQLKKREDNALFGYNVGPHSWKKFLHAPLLQLWKATKTVNSFEVHAPAKEVPRYAFIGVRSCELHAILIQDRVLLQDRFADPHYAARRVDALIIAVQCTNAGGTCFCASMETGPRAGNGFDLAITEIIEAEQHYFVIEVGSDKGAEIVAQIPHSTATEKQWAHALQSSERAATHMGRQMDTREIKALLYRNAEHPRWDDTADRCLACANCTMVCPTCFCTDIADITSLDGKSAERVRRWDSCFNSRFSYIHGGNVRQSTHARYRQWLTHKLASWHDQFGSSGCVGCGRCISWCPVGIDITEEVAALQATDLTEY